MLIHFPDGVAFPESSEQVRELLAYARENNLVYSLWWWNIGGGPYKSCETSDQPVLTIDMAKMKSLLSIDTESQLATFGAGAPGPVVEETLKEHGLHVRPLSPILGAIYLRRMGR